jgi:ABC-type cobalamin/Fe3+-siderophores transport system ATPase subunit
VSAPRVLLACEGLSVRRGGRDVVRAASLELRAGDTVALFGPNGVGKSTLLDALAGALPPAGGRVERAGRVAIALQSADLARRSVTANLVAALAWWGVPRAQRRERAERALAAMGAAHLAARQATELSGGERRRVHLARVLATEADILLLDEPFAGLDAEVRADLLSDAAGVLRAPDRATLVVVHDRAEAWALADRLAIMLDGRIAASGHPRELLDAPPTAEVARFLGFDGELRDAAGVRLTRAAHVALDPAGDLRATVTRLIPLEDGFRVELSLANGRLYCVAPLPGPALGDEVAVRVTGGVRYAPPRPAVARA